MVPSLLVITTQMASVMVTVVTMTVLQKDRRQVVSLVLVRQSMVATGRSTYADVVQFRNTTLQPMFRPDALNVLFASGGQTMSSVLKSKLRSVSVMKNTGREKSTDTTMSVTTAMMRSMSSDPHALSPLTTRLNDR